MKNTDHQPGIRGFDLLGLRPRLWLVRTFGAFEQPPNPSAEGAKYDSLGRSPRPQFGFVVSVLPLLTCALVSELSADESE